MKLKAFSVLVGNPREKNQETDGPDEECKSRDGHFSLRRTLHDTEYRRKVVHTAWLALASFVCGWVVGQRGPSILELAKATRAGVQKTSALFSLGAAGHLLGCLASGVTFGRFHKLMSLFWSAIGLAVTTVLLPLCSSYGAQGAVYCLNFLFLGWLESGAWADVARMWGFLGMQVQQILQLVYITGGAVSPIVTMIFLVDHPSEQNAVDGYFNDTTNTTSAGRSHGRILPWNRSVDFWHRERASSRESVQQPHGNWSENDSEESSWSSLGTATVQYAYLISSLLCALASLPFLIRYMTRKRPQSTSRKPWLEATTDEDAAPQTARRGLVLALTGLYFFLASAVDESAHQFLSMYLVQEVGWPASQAALATSVYWLSMGFVRVLDLSLPHASLPALLVLSTSSCACALGGLYASAAAGSEVGVWSCVSLAAASVSLILPTSFAWLDLALARVSGSVALVIMLAGSMAGVVNPLVLGPLLQEYTYAWYLYLLTSEVALSLPLLLAMFGVARSFVSRSQRKPRKSIHVDQVTDDEV